MNIIIPMAGKGTRLRPHTLTVPKPLIPVAGKPIIQRLVEELARAYSGAIQTIAFVVGDFGAEVERELVSIAQNLGARGKIFYQEKALGVGHAIYCAREALRGPCMIAFADTLFKADFSFDPQSDGVIWVQRVKDPSAFGVVRLDSEGFIAEFVEKPSTFVSDLAIVGIYYLRRGEVLADALQYVIGNDIKEKNEYQLTTALEHLRHRGLRFRTGEVDEWLDCGNKEAILFSNARMLELHAHEPLISPKATVEHSIIIPPCFVGDGAVVRHSVIGPFVSVGHQSVVESAVITNSIIQNKSHIRNALLENSMVGNVSKYIGSKDELNLGDYSHLSKR